MEVSMKTILMLAIVGLFSVSAFAGKQINTKIDNPKFSINILEAEFSKEYTIAVEGTYKKKGKKAVDVVCDNTGTAYLYAGVMNKVNCDKYYKCELINLRPVGNKILADVIDDSKKIGELEIGKVAGFDLIPTATLEPKWTEDKYSILEHAQGLKDKSYCSISIK